MIETRSAPPRYVRPGFIVAHVVNPMFKVLGAPTLTVRGRVSGLPITTPISPFDYEGARYLVAGGGETHWVRNLRAAGKGQIRSGGKHQDFRAVEINGAEHDRIVTAYRDKMGGRSRSYFEALPKPADHPAFRVEPM